MSTELFTVREYDIEGVVTNTWEYLAKDAADELMTTLRRGTNRECNYDIVAQRRLTRSEIFVELSKLIGQSRLPMPWQVLFNSSGEEDHHVTLYFHTSTDVCAWADEMGEKANARELGNGSTYTTSYPTWLGWMVALVASESRPAADPTTDPEPTPAAGTPRVGGEVASS